MTHLKSSFFIVFIFVFKIVTFGESDYFKHKDKTRQKLQKEEIKLWFVQNDLTEESTVWITCLQFFYKCHHNLWMGITYFSGNMVIWGLWFVFMKMKSYRLKKLGETFRFMAVFNTFYLVHSWILCLKWYCKKTVSWWESKFRELKSYLCYIQLFLSVFSG